jgi:hypothetical protein
MEKVLFYYGVYNRVWEVLNMAKSFLYINTMEKVLFYYGVYNKVWESTEYSEVFSLY